MLGYNVSWLWDNSAVNEVCTYSASFGRYFLPAKEVTKEVVQKLPAGMMMIAQSSRQWVRVAGLSGALAVGLGAYGAHVFAKGTHPPELKQVYDTANKYHFLHSIALLGAPLCGRPNLVGNLMVCGVVLFSGTCYYYAITGDARVRQFTPYGGMSLIAAWLAMLL